MPSLAKDHKKANSRRGENTNLGLLTHGVQVMKSGNLLIRYILRAFSGFSMLCIMAIPIALTSLSASAAEHSGSGGEMHEGGGGHGGGKGYRGGKSPENALSGEESESDKRGPHYTGERETGKPGVAGTKKGGDYGDLWVILRDPLTGEPIYTKWVDGEMVVTTPEEGFIQPLDKEGNPIPLNTEGEPTDPDAVVEVSFDRLNMGRSPSKVLDHAYDEAVSSIINSTTPITYDSAGRLVVTIDGEQKVIDSPLENLALYSAFLKDGGLTITNSSGEVVYSTSDPEVAASLLAAASSKEAAINIDSVMYLNENILHVPTDSLTDFTYSRSGTYAGVILTDANGNTLDALTVLNDLNGDIYADAGVSGFAQAADDARTIIEFVHNNPVFPADMLE